MKGQNYTRRLATAGLIAALYTALSVGLTPLSYGLVQCRVAEAFTVLAAVTPAAIPGLAVGCLITNLLGISMGANVAGAVDAVLGPLATLAAATLAYRWRTHTLRGIPVVSMLCAVWINAVVVGTELAVVSPHFSLSVWVVQMALVAAGQLIACLVGGLLLLRMLRVTGLEEKIK